MVVDVVADEDMAVEAEDAVVEDGKRSYKVSELNRLKLVCELLMSFLVLLA